MTTLCGHEDLGLGLGTVKDATALGGFVMGDLVILQLGTFKAQRPAACWKWLPKLSLLPRLQGQ